MSTLPIVEFRDPDGSYVLAQPLNEVCCRVLASNALPQGQVLYKDEAIDWEEAAQDLGGFTRLGPDQLRAPEDGPERASDDYRDLLQGLLPEPDPLALIEDPQSSKSHERPEDAGPRARILRLVLHYKKVHEEKGARARGMNVCRCPQFAPEGDVSQARLHARVSLALLRRELPSLPRILRAIGDVSSDRAKVA